MSERNLFGAPVEHGGALTDAEWARRRRRASEKPKGHAAPIGSGPAGESCRSCAHCIPVQANTKHVHKCGKARHRWTRSVRTDVRLRDAACRLWESRG